MNTDQAGLTIIRVINILCMPLFVKDTNTFLIFLINMVNTETAILQMYNQIVGEPRLKFVIAYFGRLVRGREWPDQVLTSIKEDKQIKTENNIISKLNNNNNNKKFKRNKSKGTKPFSNNKSTANNTNKNDKKGKVVGDIDHSTFNQ